MAVKETIAIVGATGTAGRQIAYKLAATTHRLLLLSTDIDSLVIMAADLKATAKNAEVEVIDCLKDGCWEAEIIVLAVSTAEEKEVAEKIKEVATQKIVVRVLLTEKIPSFARTYLQALQPLLPFSKIVTALFTSSSLNDIIVTGNDTAAVEAIVNIAAKAGFDVATQRQ